LRDADAAKRLFRNALSDLSHPQPRVINTDLAPIYGSAIADIKKEDTLRSRCRHRPVQYLNSIIEQDHRAIKRRVNAKQGFPEFQAARRTIQGYEAMNIIRKGQVRWRAGLASSVRIGSSTNSSKWPPDLPGNDAFSANSCSAPKLATLPVCQLSAQVDKT
jgi:transposase-like protein